MLIDVHNHSMPGVDDGSPDMDTTFHMFQMAYENDIRAIILTPHYRSSMPDEVTHNRYKAFQKALWVAEKVSPDLKLYLGAELFYDSEMLKKLQSGRAPTLNGTRYILVEFPVYAEVTGITKDSKVAVLHFNSETNAWENVDATAGDGTITFTVNSLSPFAFLVDANTAKNAGSTTSPATGEANTMAWVAIVAVAAAAGMVVTYRKKRA